MNVKPYRIALLIIVLANFLLFIFTVIQPLVFWSVIIIAAILAYKVLPKLEEDL